MAIPAPIETTKATPQAIEIFLSNLFCFFIYPFNEKGIYCLLKRKIYFKLAITILHGLF